MGNSSSSGLGLRLGRRRCRRHRHNSDQVKQLQEVSGRRESIQDDEKPQKDRKRIFLYNWKIEGFSSSLVTLRDLRSGIFQVGGYEWFLKLRTTKDEDGKSYISLCLCIIDLLSDWKVEAEYTLLLYDEKHGNHIKEKGIRDFNTSSSDGAFHNLVPLETFKDASSGFLINDSCIFGIEILRVFDKSPTKVISEHLSLCSGSASHILYTWKVQSCRQLEHKETSSEAFVAGRLKWYILIIPESEGSKYISIKLKLDSWDASLIEPGVYVEFSLCMKDQMRGKHIKNTGFRIFNLDYNKWGWMKFLTSEDFNNPTKGFLVDNTCIIEASVAVVGSLSRDNKVIY